MTNVSDYGMVGNNETGYYATRKCFLLTTENRYYDGTLLKDGEWKGY